MLRSKVKVRLKMKEKRSKFLMFLTVVKNVSITKDVSTDILMLIVIYEYNKVTIIVFYILV